MRAAYVWTVVVVGLLAGCTSGSPHSAPVSSSASAAPAISSALPVTVTSLRAQITPGRCAGVPGGWQLSGTAHNVTSDQVRYAIVVNFTSAQATVLAQGRTTVTVRAGKTGEWTVTQKFAAPKQVLCVVASVS